jgi:hypothetical protein
MEMMTTKMPDNTIKGVRVIIQRILLLIIFASCLGGCVTAKKVDTATTSKYEGFIKDGKTTRQEIQDRLGPCNSVYEKGRILVYHVYLEDDGRMNLKGRGTCYACVLVFDINNVLERHSLVKHGCK